MHHLARRTSLVGRQPEALRSRIAEEGASEEEKMKENSGRGEEWRAQKKTEGN